MRQTLTQIAYLREEAAGVAAVNSGAQAFHDLHERKTSFGDSEPLGTGEDSYAAQILGTQFDFPPLGIGGKFSPHLSTAVEKHGAAQFILLLAG